MLVEIVKMEKIARNYFLHGGGDFEDGEAGARAVSFTFDGMVEMAACFAQHALENLEIVWHLDREK